MVVMERKHYIEKSTNLLAQPAYRTINRNLINKLKAKLITLLRKIKRETGLGTGIYKYMYPTGCISPKFYGLFKIHKTNTFSGLQYLAGAKILAKILKHLVGNSLHHVHSTKDFVERVSKVTLQ